MPHTWIFWFTNSSSQIFRSRSWRPAWWSPIPNDKVSFKFWSRTPEIKFSIWKIMNEVSLKWKQRANSCKQVPQQLLSYHLNSWILKILLGIDWWRLPYRTKLCLTKLFLEVIKILSDYNILFDKLFGPNFFTCFDRAMR